MNHPQSVMRVRLNIACKVCNGALHTIRTDCKMNIMLYLSLSSFEMTRSVSSLKELDCTQVDCHPFFASELLDELEQVILSFYTLNSMILIMTLTAMVMSILYSFPW